MIPKSYAMKSFSLNQALINLAFLVFQVSEETGEHAEISVAMDDVSSERKGSGKSKRSRKKKAKDAIHKVTMTVTIAKAIPTGKNEFKKFTFFTMGVFW